MLGRVHIRTNIFFLILVVNRGWNTNIVSYGMHEGDEKYIQKALVGKRPFGRHRSRWENNIGTCICDYRRGLDW
jgi:hypothetical protein